MGESNSARLNDVIKRLEGLETLAAADGEMAACIFDRVMECCESRFKVPETRLLEPVLDSDSIEPETRAFNAFIPLLDVIFYRDSDKYTSIRPGILAKDKIMADCILDSVKIVVDTDLANGNINAVIAADVLDLVKKYKSRPNLEIVPGRLNTLKNWFNPMRFFPRVYKTQ